MIFESAGLTAYDGAMTTRLPITSDALAGRAKQCALAAWAAYQATGKHVTAAEAEAWLARIEAGEDAEPPAAHG